MKKWKFILIGAVILAVGYVVVSCVIQNNDKNPAADLPKEAVYKLTINTGTVFPTKVIPTVQGAKVGERIFTLHGYWQLSDKKYVYKNIVLPMDEKVFGEIRMEVIKK